MTEGDLDRGHAPDLTSPHWRCGIVDPATGAVCTHRPHSSDVQHCGYQAVQGTGRSIRLGRAALLHWVEGNGGPALGDGPSASGCGSGRTGRAR